VSPGPLPEGELSPELAATLLRYAPGAAPVAFDPAAPGSEKTVSFVWPVAQTSLSAGVEADPTGRSSKDPGSKLDKGKLMPDLVIGGFPRALWEVTRVGTEGANKYTPDGWQTVPGGERRYAEANMRHWLKRKMGRTMDEELPVLHEAQEIWNALASLELKLRELEKQGKWNPEEGAMT